MGQKETSGRKGEQKETIQPKEKEECLQKYKEQYIPEPYPPEPISLICFPLRVPLQNTTQAVC